MIQDSIFERVAQQNNTTADKVRSEIAHAIEIAMANSDISIQEKWALIPADDEAPTPEELLVYLVRKILQEA